VTKVIEMLNFLEIDIVKAYFDGQQHVLDEADKIPGPAKEFMWYLQELTKNSHQAGLAGCHKDTCSSSNVNIIKPQFRDCKSQKRQEMLKTLANRQFVSSIG
jgi:hypothetical protein